MEEPCSSIGELANARSPNCTCGGGHETYGACLRAKGIRIGWSQSAKGLDATEEKAKWRELESYKSARNQGIQPGSTSLTATRFALDASDATGTAFDAGRPSSAIKDLDS